MANKTILLENIGEVTLAKRSGQKSIRLSVSAGKIKVTQPSWLPYSAGEAYLRSKLDWVKEHHKPSSSYHTNQQIGKKHLLVIEYGDKQSTRIKNGIIDVTLLYGQSELTKSTQTLIEKAVIKALRDESESYLPQRTKELAYVHGFSFKSVSIKHLKRRWGSCNSKNEITYNLFLMNLADDLINYVILHELCHTKHMNHGDKFWAQMESVYPGARRTAKVVRRHQS